MQVVSLKKESDFLKICLIEKKFRKLSVKYLDTIDLSKKEEFNKTDPLKRLEKFLDKKANWVVSLSSSEVIEKVAEFPDLTWSKIQDLIPFQVEALFPYDRTGFELVQKKEKSKGIKNILFRLVPKDTIQNKILSLNQMGIEVDAAIFDKAAIEKMFLDYQPQEETLFIHLNHLETHLVLAEKKEIKTHLILEKGYCDFENEKKGLKESQYLKELFWLMKLHEIDQPKKIVLSGLFIEIDHLSPVFLDYVFISDDNEATRYSQEIANAQLFLKSKEDTFLVEHIEQPKKKATQDNIFKKLIVGLVALCFISFLSIQWLQYQTKEKITLFLDVGGLFKGQSLPKVLSVMKQFKEKQQPILDLQRQPIGIERILLALEKPFLSHHCQLKEFHYELEKYPTFKNPSQPFFGKLTILIIGDEKELERLQADIRKLPFVDKKKNMKIEKKKNETILEIFIL